MAHKQRKVLILSYIFPPFFSAGGSIRAVKFVKHLPARGWEPLVLTINDVREYDTQRKEGSQALLDEIPQEARVFRTGTAEPSQQLLETGRRLRQRNSIGAVIVNVLGAGRHWAIRHLLHPDRYIVWMPFALRTGRRIVRDERVDAIFATCPPHSMSIIGAALKLLTRRPLVLDFRDDWVGTPWYLANPKPTRWFHRQLETFAVRTADRVILVTDWSRNEFVSRYPDQWEGKFVHIPNGCDLEDFTSLERVDAGPDNSKFTILHTGLMSDANGWSRDPEPLFRAVASIREHRPDVASRLRISLVGHVSPAYRGLISTLGLTDIVREFGNVPHRKSIELMASADLLLAINSDNLPTVVPGKIYEYWAVKGPPILLLSHPGAAQTLVDEYRLGYVTDPYDVQAIKRVILEVYDKREAGHPRRLSSDGIANFDRKILTGQLAEVLSAISLQPPHSGSSREAAWHH